MSAGIAAGALLAWALFVTWRGGCLPIDGLAGIVGEIAAAGAGSMRAWSQAAGLALNLLVLAALLAACWGAGGLAARGLRLKLDAGGETLVVELALGVAAATAGLGGAAMLGVLGARAVLALAGAGLAAALLRVRRGERPRLVPAASRGERALVMALAAPCLLVAAGSAVLCVAPELNYDALLYHLADARLDILHGTVPRQPYNMYSRFPQGVELLHAGALSLTGGDMLPRLVHLSLALLTAGGAAVLARRASGPVAGAIAATLLLTTPVAVLNASAALVDFGTAAFMTCALVVLQPWLAEPGADARRPALAGLFAGFAMGSKYSAFETAALLGLVLLAAAAWGRLRPRASLPALAAYGLATLVGAGPWLLRNALIDGNPLAPFFGSVFGHAVQPAAIAAFLADLRHHEPLGPSGWLRLPWELGVETRDWHQWLGPAWLALLPAAAWPGARERRAARVVIAFAVAALALSFAQTSIVRFAYPALAATAAVAGAGLAGMARDRLSAALVATAVLVPTTGCALTAFHHALAQRECAGVLLGAETAGDYLDRPHPALYPRPSHAAMTAANAMLPRDAVVLLVGETRGFHLERRFVAVSPFDDMPLWQWARESASGADLARALRGAGITHVLLNERELSRTGRSDEARRLPRAARDALADFWSRRARVVYRDESAVLVEVPPG